MARSGLAGIEATERESNGGDGGDCSLPPVETLALVTDETRRAIVATLWNAERPLRFSTLRRRSGIEESSRFNYHLDRLREQCVRDTGDGYVLTLRGERFVEALAGVPTVDASVEP
jgi:hypothetical protein